MSIHLKLKIQFHFILIDCNSFSFITNDIFISILIFFNYTFISFFINYVFFPFLISKNIKIKTLFSLFSLIYLYFFSIFPNHKLLTKLINFYYLYFAIFIFSKHFSFRIHKYLLFSFFPFFNKFYYSKAYLEISCFCPFLF